MHVVTGAREGGALDFTLRHLGAAQAMWARLTESDYAGIRNVDALTAAVAERYGIPHGVAKDQVETWLGVVGQRRHIG